MDDRRKETPPGAGRSSFELIDPLHLFAELHLKRGQVLLDMGCGRGSYALAAAQYLGDTGVIYALDLWEEGIAWLQKEAEARNIKNIKAMLADITKPTPLKARSIDVCLMATVLHDLALVKAEDGALQEVVRLIRPKGVFAVLEFKKMDGPPGPPRSSRLAPEEVEGMVSAFGFRKKALVELGPYNYLLLVSQNGLNPSEGQGNHARELMS